MERIKKHLGWHYLEDPKHLFFVIALVIGGIFGVRYSLYAYPEVFKVDFNVEKTKNILPNDSIIINFSQPVSSSAYEKDVVVEPNENIKMSWDNGYKRLIITPKYAWKLETYYSITLPETQSKIFTNIDKAKIEFSTLRFPHVKSIFPEKGSKDVVLDIEDPIRINFDSSINGFFVKFTLDPESQVAYENNLDKTQFRLVPEGKLKEGSAYALKIFMKYENAPDSTYQEIYSTSFETLPPPPATWEKDFNLRLEQAKKYTAAKIASGKYIDINLASQVLSIFENGNMLDAYMISSGKRGMETSKGQFSIYNKASRVWSKRYGLYMPFWMAVAANGSFGIHELPEWPSGYKEGANHLGIPVSHGCIRLGVGPAKRVFDWTEVGTPVVIH